MNSHASTSSWSDKLLRDVGEQRLLDLLAPYLASPDDQIAVGVGDDAAVVCHAKDGAFDVLTTDMLIEGTHFPPRTNTPWHGLGHKALASNLSDIAAMGAVPRYVLVSLGAPADLPVQAVLDLYQGMFELARLWGVKIVGGDTVGAPVVVIAITVIGECGDGLQLPLRSHCCPGQNVYVSGNLGASLAGLRLILDASLRERFSRDIADSLIQCHWYPSPRIDLGQALATSVADLAMIDISDSLYHELRLLAGKSRVGFQIELDALPTLPVLATFAKATETSPSELALFSGEEYELLFTTVLEPPDLKRVLERHGLEVEVTRIGVVTPCEGQIEFLLKGERIPAPTDRTFDHFRLC